MPGRSIARSRSPADRLFISFVALDLIKALFWAAVINGVLAVPLTGGDHAEAMRPDVMGCFVLPRPLWAMVWLCTMVMAIGVGSRLQRRSGGADISTAVAARVAPSAKSAVRKTDGSSHGQRGSGNDGDSPVLEDAQRGGFRNRSDDRSSLASTILRADKVVVAPVDPGQCSVIHVLYRWNPHCERTMGIPAA